MPEYDSTIQYRDIPGFPGYTVGSDGSVWCCRPINGKGKFQNWRKLKPTKINKSGHCRVDLFRGSSERHLRYIHRLVLEVFIGPCPSGMECRHFPDGNPGNNHLENIQWSTHKTNSNDRFFQGTDNRGFKHPKSNVTKEIIIAIKSELKKGTNQHLIAKKFKMAQASISRINCGKRYADVF